MPSNLVVVGRGAEGEFALNLATKVLPFYEKYFGVKYPLPKLDMVPLADFAVEVETYLS